MMMRLILLCFLSLTVTYSHALMVPQRSCKVRSSSVWASLQEPPSKDSMKHDIEVMRLEALQRLEAAKKQMEELKRSKETDNKLEEKEEALEVVKSNVPNAVQVEPPEIKTPASAASLDSLEGDISTTTASPPKPKQPSKEPNNKEKEDVRRMAPPVMKPRYDLLDNTRWKIAFNIGREANTWMPADWGASGDRLVFTAVVDFTSEPLYEREEFFQGIAGAKVLEVEEAWILPVGVGVESRGRRPIQVKPTGGYKVVPGQGPVGTDIVRFYIELEETVQARPGSDVYCPAGRVYGTCGYFQIHEHHAPDAHAWKDIIAEEHHAILMKYNQLQNELDQDSRLVSLEKFQKMKELFDVKQQLDRVTERLNEARQKDPERSQLRLSRKGDVGLTKEGGVVCKVHKGLALEYHILGKMELASIKMDEHHHDNEHEPNLTP